jgi:hypothetical protein
MMQIIRVIISFFIVFNFPIPIIYNSSLLAVVISGLMYFYRPDLFLNPLYKLIKTRYIFRIFIILFSVIIFSFLIAILYGTNDFGIIKGFVLQLTLLLAALFSYPILIRPDQNPFENIIIILIYIFFVQSIIEIAAFVFPPFSEIVNFFHKPEIALRGGLGFRALALTGNPFFDLAAGFGWIYILFFKYIQDHSEGRFDVKKIFIFMILLIGALFAGRSAFIGLLLGLVLYFISMSSSIRIKILNFFKIIFYTIFLSLIVFEILPKDTQELITQRLLPFAFEFIYNYYYTGEATTESTKELSQMYFPIEFKTFLLGDGRYVSPEGGYYMGTDAGYMRQILFYGLIGSIITLFYQLSFFRKPIKIIVNQLRKKNRSNSLNDLLFYFLLFIYILIINYKGEVIGYLNITQVMLFWLMISFSQSHQNKQLNIE